MKPIFKFLLLAIVAFMADITKSSAQSGPIVCAVKYDYDVSGNRIKRKYECAPTWTPSDPMQWSNNTIFTTVFPNPTSGVITGVFSSPIGGEAGSALISISTIDGITIFSQEYTEITSSVTMDISQQIPGQYLLIVAAFNKVETYIITKL